MIINLVILVSWGGHCSVERTNLQLIFTKKYTVTLIYLLGGRLPLSDEGYIALTDKTTGCYQNLDQLSCGN